MLNIYRGDTVNLNINIDNNTRLIRQLLGEDIIKSSFSFHTILDIAIGDYIVFDDVKYYINNLPNIKKNSSNSFDYDITFESEYYELLKTQFLDSDGNSDFSLVGNLETFIDLIITNMNRISSGWARGICDQTNADYKLLNFSKYNCMQVLQTLCEEFEGEFFFDFEMVFGGLSELPYLPAADAVIPYQPAAEAEHYYKPAENAIAYYLKKDIRFTDKAGSDSRLTFLYHQGLRNIQRTTLSEKNIITRLYAFGSRRNLASDYRDHSTRLKFVNGGLLFLEKNLDKYGTIEHTEIFEDIYPHRDGTISTVDGADITKFFDNGMDFDLNDYLLPGVNAKLHFNSGNLGGYEFEVSNYNNITQEFTIIAFTDEIGYTMPNATLKPAIGDKYVLIDIKMPQTYIDTAEATLLTKAQTYLDDNCEPRVTYILEPDWRYFKLHTISLEVGDFITIQDTDLGINVMTRIVELTKSLANEYKYTLKLTDHLEVQLIQRMYSEQEDLKKKIEIGEGGDVIRSRRNWRTSEELRTMVFDTDGYFDMGNIRPESIETSMLSVGSKSTQFILSGVEIEGNYTSDVSKFHASAGSLIHLSIADEIRTWTLFENTQTALVDLTAYYIYAKCTIEPGYTGQIIVDSTQRKFDDDPTYYYFLIGVLHSVVDGVRGVSLTYGQTIINGKFIRTGKIESTDGNTYFDLDNNTIQGSIIFRPGSSGLPNVSDFTWGNLIDDGSKPADYADVTDYADPQIANALLENNVLRVDNPQGASYSGGANDTGAIVITLPQSWTSTMMFFNIEVYQYSVDKSFTLHVGGQNPTPEAAWWNTTANLSGSIAANNRVRFGHDGTKCCIVIGDIDSVWQYPKVSVRLFQAGYQNYAKAQWESGWLINVISDLTGYTFTSDIADSLIDAKISEDTNAVAGLASSIIAAWAANSDITYIDGGKIYTGSIYAEKLNISNLADIANLQLGATGYIRTTGKTSYADTDAGFWLGYDVAAYKLNIGDAANYIKWDGSNLAIKGNVTITGGSGIANLTDVGALAMLDSIAYAAITGGKPPTDADNTSANSQSYAWITGTKPPTNADYFAGVAGALAYYNLVSAAVLDSTIIVGGFIKTSLLTANNIRVGTLQSVRFNCGGGTDEDIFFEDSGVRMYDAGSRIINIYKPGYKALKFSLGTTAGEISTDGVLQIRGHDIDCFTGTKVFSLFDTGILRLPSLTSNPSGTAGGICMVNNQLKYWDGSAWINA